jgi:intracellular sulfur oxidation DsrE/DsrF family protein
MIGNGSGFPARRSFLSRLAGGLTMIGAALVAGESSSQAQSAGSTGWAPTRHTQDDWLDALPGKHRFVFDTTSPAGLGSVLLYANNFFLANQNGYGLGNSDAAVVIVVRHNSTSFAYTDAMWSKYGGPLGQAGNFDDPKTKQHPAINVYNSTNHTTLLPNNGVTIDSLTKRGVHFAVCEMATRRFAGAVAAATGVTTDRAFDELRSNLVANAHLVPAGIVAVNRAQERGYTFAHGG